jgi:hypothetical protein
VTSRGGYRYALEVHRADGSTVDQRPAQLDWGPAVEWGRWQLVRRGWPVADALLADVVIRPVWSAAGAPYVGGVEILAPPATGAADDRLDVVPIEYFGDAANALARILVGEGQLTDGELFRYLPLAFADGEPIGPPATRVVRTAPRIDVVPGGLAEALAGGTAEGGQDDIDAPVLIPDEVLAECAALTLEHSGVETGGVLIGRLTQDRASAKIYLEVTAQVAARHTEASATKLTFTPETWSDVRAAIALRGLGEIQLGSWHSHPVKVMCTCPEEKRRAGCPLGLGFFSADDRVLHRTVFSRAFNVALVVSDVHEGPPTFALFGWRRGVIERRGFHRIGAMSHATT